MECKTDLYSVYTHPVCSVVYIITLKTTKRDRCVGTRGSFEILHSVVYIETKHGGIAIHCVLVMRTSMGSPNPCFCWSGLKVQ